jgi:hypothetical protein
MLSPWPVYESIGSPRPVSDRVTICNENRYCSFSVHGRQTNSQSTENNMMLVGIPPQPGGVSGQRRGAWVSELRGRIEMDSRRIAFVAGFCIAGFMASGAYADKPDKPPGKPGGGNDQTRGECIVFVDNQNDSGDDHVWLQSSQECAIEGCCPNAGPWPQYLMALHNVRYTPALGEEDEKVTLDNQLVLGYLFMNSFGRNAPYEGWLVQFWTCDYRSGERPGDGDFFFQIRGGTGGLDRKTKVSVIEFLDANDASLWVYYTENPDCDFPSETGCEPCSNGMETGCDPWTDDECLYPCWIEQPLENVSFVIVRTADLTYASPELGITCPDSTCVYTP